MSDLDAMLPDLERTIEVLVEAKKAGPTDIALQEQAARLGQEFMDRWGTMPVQVLNERHDELSAKMEDAKRNLARVNTRLATLLLIGSEPVIEETPEMAVGVKGPKQQRQLVAQTLLDYVQEFVPYDERAVTRGLDPLPRPEWARPDIAAANGVALLRTAGYFVLNRRDAQDALASSPPEQEVFPPLPFKRVWIEMADGNRAVPYMRYRRPEEDRDSEYGDLMILGVGLVEVDQGTLLDVYIAMRYEKRDDSFFFVGVRIAPEGTVSRAEPEDEEGELLLKGAFNDVRALAVGGIHLITARNVPHEPVILLRQQRRAMNRMGVPEPPKIYYVNLAASGERDEHSTGQRQYRVRWLVRGHWRHMDSGQRLCTCCDPRRVATWIEPYVKGPAGAPWKGRAVHVQRPTEEEER